MSKFPFSRRRESSPNRRAPGRNSSRNNSRRNLAFETLERRELLAVSALSDFSANENTGEKPQSKVWEYNDVWYSVMPDSGGTWVWKLNGTQWQKQVQITNNNGYHADVKVDGNLAHILLFDGSRSQLATVEYDSGPDNRYELWSLRPSLVNVAISSSAETAVIDIDSTGRMWVAYDTSSSIEVRYADVGAQYSNWSAPITVVSGIKSDDIGTLIAMPNGTIGVMWSNQNTSRFGFRLHVDGTNPSTWLNAEVPASQSAQNKGGGMADDHINLAVASDGTLYAAVKTSYDSSGYPRMCLLVRRPSGVWDNLYEVDSIGTRPIVMINEAAGKLIVAYTQSDSGGNIYFKESPLQNISFGSRQTLISGSVNNVSSVKAPFTDEVVAIAAGGSKVKASLFRFDGPIVSPPPQNQAPNVNAGPDQTIPLSGGAALDGTVTDDGRPVGGTLTTNWAMVSGPGVVTFASASSIDTTATFSAAGTYVLRLSANDSSLQASDTVTIVVQPPVGPPVNQPPSVNAGPDRSIVLGAAASLDGTVGDDGLPSSPGLVTTTWSKVSGPGTVTFGSASAVDTTASFSAAGTYVLRLTGSDGSLSASDEMTVTVASNSAPISIAFQDGLYPTINYQGTRDTKIATKSQNTNYGTAATIDLDGSPDISDLFYWDIRAIPAGSVIESVTIQLNVTNTSSQAYEFYEMLRSWDELTATWNQASNGNPWGSAGAQGTGDHGATVLGALTASSKGLHQIVLNASGIAVVQAWINNPASNQGVILQDYSNSSGVDISTSEASTAAQRPKLVVTYRAAEGGPLGSLLPTNQAPTVDAGADQSIQLPNSASLNGTVTDDGLPNSPGTVTRTWTRISGPGTVTFGNATSANTTASFSAAGTYVLRLTASDGSLQASDDVTITVLAAAAVNQPPTVNAGNDQQIQLPNSASLSATVTDDGLPISPGTVTRVWSRQSGPGTVTFANASSATTTASFSTAGTYVLRLTANDGSLQAFDELTVTVLAAAPVNQPPVVNVGSNQTIQLPALASLSATVTDTGGPLATPLLVWTRVSGPGTVSFSNPNSANTTAGFSVAGTYVLRLTANDGQYASFDELTLTVGAASQSQAEKLLEMRRNAPVDPREIALNLAGMLREFVSLRTMGGMTQAYLAIDLGAESGRVIAGTLADGRMRLDEIHRFVHEPVWLPTGLHWDVTGIWREIVTGLRKAAAWAGEQHVRLVSVGVDTWGVDWALVDKAGELIGLPHAYRDPRNQAAYERVVAQLGAERIYQTTGIQFMALNTLYSLYAQQLADPAALKSADRLLFMPDLIHFWLGGEMAVEATIASTSQMVDCHSGNWAGEMLAELGLPAHILQPTVAPGTVISTIRKQLATDTGLPTDLKVVAPASHDTASAIAAVPAAENSSWCYLSSGTWSLLGAELDEPCVSLAAQEAMFTNELGVLGTTRFLKNIPGLWLVQECRRDLARQGRQLDYVALTRLASESQPFRTLIDPAHAAFQAPGEMLAKIAAVANCANQPAPDLPGQFVRCCLESLALAYRDKLATLESILDRRFDVIHIVGGGGKNEILNQMTADATGRRVVVGPYEATALGNSLVQAMAAGDVRDLVELRRVVAQSFDLTTFEPTSTREWESASERFLAICN